MAKRDQLLALYELADRKNYDATQSTMGDHVRLIGPGRAVFILLAELYQAQILTIGQLLSTETIFICSEPLNGLNVTVDGPKQDADAVFNALYLKPRDSSGLNLPQVSVFLRSEKRRHFVEYPFLERGQIQNWLRWLLHPGPPPVPFFWPYPPPMPDARRPIKIKRIPGGYALLPCAGLVQ